MDRSRLIAFCDTLLRFPIDRSKIVTESESRAGRSLSDFIDGVVGTLRTDMTKDGPVGDPDQLTLRDACSWVKKHRHQSWGPSHPYTAMQHLADNASLGAFRVMDTPLARLHALDMHTVSRLGFEVPMGVSREAVVPRGKYLGEASMFDAADTWRRATIDMIFRSAHALSAFRRLIPSDAWRMTAFAATERTLSPPPPRPTPSMYSGACTLDLKQLGDDVKREADRTTGQPRDEALAGAGAAAAKYEKELLDAFREYTDRVWAHTRPLGHAVRAQLADVPRTLREDPAEETRSSVTLHASLLDTISRLPPAVAALPPDLNAGLVRAAGRYIVACYTEIQLCQLTGAPSVPPEAIHETCWNHVLVVLNGIVARAVHAASEVDADRRAAWQVEREECAALIRLLQSDCDALAAAQRRCDAQIRNDIAAAAAKAEALFGQYRLSGTQVALLKLHIPDSELSETVPSCCAELLRQLVDCVSDSWPGMYVRDE